MTTSSGLQSAHHAELVHEARKAIKRMRAFARLQRYELGEREFHRVNSSLRVTARRLSQARDAEVRLATLEHLRRLHPDGLHSDGVERLDECLRHERDDTRGPALEPAALEEIGQMRCELARWKHASHDSGELERGLRCIYREGRRRHKLLKRGKKHDVEALHDWRKRVKDLYYALEMLGGAETRGARASTRRAKRIGELLGEEHDLWLLTAYVREHTDPFVGDEDAQQTLLAFAERRRKHLRSRALSRGARLYKRKPRAFAKRMREALPPL